MERITFLQSYQTSSILFAFINILANQSVLFKRLMSWSDHWFFLSTPSIFSSCGALLPMSSSTTYFLFIHSPIQYRQMNQLQSTYFPCFLYSILFFQKATCSPHLTSTSTRSSNLYPLHIATSTTDLHITITTLATIPSTTTLRPKLPTSQFLNLQIFPIFCNTMGLSQNHLCPSSSRLTLYVGSG